MTDKNKDKELNKPADELLKEKVDEGKKVQDDAKDVFPLGEANDKLNPTDGIADEAKAKEEAGEELTEQEKFVERKEGINTFHEAAGLGAGATGSASSDDGLADLGLDGKPKKIVPPVTAGPASDEGDDENFEFHGESEDEVEFDPVNDPKAAHHGTHDAAVFGLHTDLSGTYVPPGLVKHAEDTNAEAENQERLRRANAQQRELAYDSWLRHDRRF